MSKLWGLNGSAGGFLAVFHKITARIVAGGEQVGVFLSTGRMESIEDGWRVDYN